MKLLLVDDAVMAHKMFMIHLKPYLDESDIVVDAYNGLEAVEKYKQEKFDLVCMDLTMPVMNGHEASKNILEYDENAYIIILTADIQDSTKNMLLSVGVKDFINKPISGEKIKEILSNFKDI
jgi:CheY-like chemotaxis protein